MVSESGTHQSIERAIAVLRVLNDAGAGLRVAEVAKLTDLGPSTTSRLLSVLEAQDLVLRDEVTGLCRLGSALISFGGTALNQRPVYRHGRAVAQRLASAYDLGSSIAARRADKLFHFCSFEGASATTPWNRMGELGPLHATSIGKCVLVDFGPAQRREMLGELEPYTSNSIIDHALLDTELELVRERGYACESAELALGRASIAATVRDQDGEIVGGISLDGSLSELDLPGREEELSRAVIEAADQISVALGFRSIVMRHNRK